MGRVKTIARRTFLVGSAAIAGGVAFGVYAVKRPVANPLSAALKDGEATFNPWVLIDNQKITLITPHADKGQGIASAQVALIAEEMDVDLDQVSYNFGQPDGAYWNTAMAAESAPFMATDSSFTAETVRDVMGGVMKVMGLQGTGGSTSIADSFDKLRRAGAIARETLKLAAAQKTGLPVDKLKTAKGAVYLPDGAKINYTDLAELAATIEPVQDVTLRDPSAWRLIGKPMERLDVLGKSTGELKYGIDQVVDGMVHATIKVNPRQGGVLNSYDATQAIKMRGVKDVFPITGGVAVVADNTWRAVQAANTISFDWGPAPYPTEQADHWAALDSSFTDEFLDSTWRDDGDVENSLSDGDVISATYRSPYVAHAPLEPLNAIVLVNDDTVQVWTGHQFPRQLQVLVAQVTGHNQDQVQFHNQFIGGSFGHRLEFDFVKQATEIANKMRGTPVKMTYSREEDFAHDFPRHIAMARATGRVTDGQVTAIDLQIASPSVIGSQMGRAQIPAPGPDAQIAAGAWNNPYSLTHYRMRAYRADELAPVSSWRSVGAASGGFFFDSFLDELIHSADADPMMERIRLMNDDVSRKVLETVADISSWGAPLAANQGRGVAFVESFGVPVAEVVEVSAVEGSIKIDKVFVACDVGQVIDPINFDNQVKGGVIWGLGHAMNCQITYSDGMAEQENYHQHEGMRLYQCPEITVRGLENGSKVRGIGEPPVPPAAPALANAIFAATGQRIRELPLYNSIDFV